MHGVRFFFAGMESTVGPYITTKDPDDHPETLTTEEIRAKADEMLQAMERREANTTPQWLAIIDDLAHGDRTKWDYFFEMPVVEFLNTYSFNLARKKELSQQLEAAAEKGPHVAIVRALNEILFTR